MGGVSPSHLGAPSHFLILGSDKRICILVHPEILLSAIISSVACVTCSVQ